MADVLARLASWLANPAKRKLGQNLKYDEHVLANHGLVLAGVAHDTLLESYVLEAHRPHDMDNLAWRHLGVKTLTYAEVAGKGAKQIDFDQVALDEATAYSAEDADITLQLHRHLHPLIAADPKLNHVYTTIEIPVREILYRMEREGVMIDAALLAAQSRELGDKARELEQRAYELAGQPFNLSSPRQLGEILFQKMKLPALRKTATGQPSTDEDVLTELAADFPLPKVLLEHRALTKLKSTYTDKLPQMVNPRTGRVHTTFSQATAVTGRLASLDPNLQNIPVRTAEGRRIREAFIAPPGHVVVSADYSQIELRIMAHLSGDEALVAAFREGADIHRATAAEIFAVALSEVSSDQRRYIKAVNFGLIYGMGAFGLAQQLGIERAAAQQFIEKYFQRYPGVARYMQSTREFARQHGYVETVFGRRLWLPDIKAAGGPRRSGAERAAINRAGKHGVLVVIAAGNASSDNDIQFYASDSSHAVIAGGPSYPASYSLKNILSVAATNDRDNYAYFSQCRGVIPLWECGFTSWGHDSVDVAAPGVDILSTVKQGQGIAFPDYEYFDGTSMASPLVAGIAGLVMSDHPAYSAIQVKNAIMHSVDRPASLKLYDSWGDVTGVGKKALFGKFTRTAGRVNADDALLETNTTKATPLTDGNIDGARSIRGKRTGSVSWPADANDVYRKKLTKGAKYHVVLNGPRGKDFDLWVWRPGTKEIFQFTARCFARGFGACPPLQALSAGHTADEAVTFKAPKTGVFYIQVNGWYSGGNYTLTIKKV